MNASDKQVTHSAVIDAGMQVAARILAIWKSSDVTKQVAKAAARYDGLVDSIARAGWDLAVLEKVRSPFDAIVHDLLDELAESYPAMSKTEREAFLQPYQKAIHQFCSMTRHEKILFKAEFTRFHQLHQQSLQLLAATDKAA